MAISFVGATTQTGDLGSGVDLTLDAVTGVADDDFLVIVGFKEDDPGGIDTPPGFTVEPSLSSVTTTGSDREMAVFYRTASSEAASYTFGHGQSATRVLSVTCLAFRDVDTGFDVTPTGSHVSISSNILNPTCPSITSVTDGAWAVAIGGQTGSSMTAAGAPSGYTLRSSVVTSNGNLYAATLEIPTAGLETPGAWTNTGTSGTQDTTQMIFVIRPAVGSVDPVKRFMLLNAG